MFDLRPLLHSTRLLLACLALIAWSGPATRAQVMPGLPYSGSVQAYFQNWTVEEDGAEERIGQVVVPVGVYLPVADGFEVRFSTAYVSLTREPEGGASETVSGTADVKVQAGRALLGRRLMLGALVNLPTGKNGLSGAQQDVVLAFVAPDLSVRANRFGEGFNVGGTLSYALAATSSSMLGLGAAFVSRGAYTTSFPGSEATFDFDPGYEATLTGAWIYTARAARLRIATSLTRHGTERIDDAEIFRLGSRLAFDVEFTRLFNDGRSTFSLAAQELFRFKNSTGLGGAFDTELLNTNGNYLILLTAFDHALTGSLSLNASGTARLISENEQGVGNASLFEGGLTASYRVAPQAALELGGRYVLGSGTGLNGSDRSIRGLEGLARLNLRF